MKVIVTVPVDAGHKALLESAAPAEFRYMDAESVSAADLADTEVLFGNVDPALIRGAQALRLLQLFSAGTDGYLDVLPAGCALTNTTGAFGLAISEHLLGMLLCLMKRLHQYRDNQLRHDWRDMGPVSSVSNAVVLVLGLGDIGGEFARKCKALGAYTIGVRRRDLTKPDYMDEVHLAADIDALLPRADVVALVMPGTPETRGMLSRERITLLKDGAIVLNAGRGSAIDTEALADAIEAGRILAGLDVTDPEPLPEDHRLWRLENALVTPHISGFFHLKKTLDNMVDIAAANIGRLYRSEPLINEVDMETGYRRK